MEVIGGLIVLSWIVLICVVVGLIFYAFAKFWKEILSLVLIGAGVIGFFMFLLWSISS
jgi:hypothetical protein